MEPSPDISSSLVRRAYKLARSGACKNLAEISRRLKMEGYGATNVDDTLEAKALIRAELTRILTAADKA